MTRISRALLEVCLLSVTALAESTTTVRGELHDVSGPADQWIVVLSSFDHSCHPQTAFVAGNGSFQILAVASGSYTLEVRTLQGDIVKQQLITVAGTSLELSVSVATYANCSAVPAGGATVSLNRLRHDPNGRATREYLLGEEFLLEE